MKIKIPKEFQIIAPRWTKNILTRTPSRLVKPCIIDGKKLNIGRYECCIVGEALDLEEKHGSYKKFSSKAKYDDDKLRWRSLSEIDYHNGCDICVMFSKILYTIICSDTDYKEKLEDTLEEFTSHIKSKHKGILRRKKKLNS